LIRMILGLNTEKRKFLRDVQDVQKFALIRTGVKQTHLQIKNTPPTRLQIKNTPPTRL
jgi:hypothetical protein